MQYGHTDAVAAVAISTDGKTVISGGEDGQLIAWDVSSGLKLRSIVTDQLQIHSVSFLPNESEIMCAGSMGVSAWDILTGQKIRQINNREAYSLAISSDKTKAVWGDTGGGVYVLDLLADSSAQSLRQGFQDKIVTSVAISPNGLFLRRLPVVLLRYLVCLSKDPFLN